MRVTTSIRAGCEYVERALGRLEEKRPNPIRYIVR
jgi:hypothetical protein